MSNIRDRIRTITEVVGYIHHHEGRPIVVVISPAIFADEEKILDLSRAINSLHKVGLEFAIIHNSSKEEARKVFGIGAFSVEGNFDRKKLRVNLAEGFTPVISRSIDEGVSIEDGAVVIADWLSATKLVFITERPGIRGADCELIHELNVETARSLLLQCKDGKSVVDGEMRRILEAAIKGCEKKISRVHVIGGEEGSLYLELLSCEGRGTMLYSDSYHLIKKADESNLSEILDIVRLIKGNSINTAYLRSHLSQFRVFCIDNEVHGCLMVSNVGKDEKKIYEITHLSFSATYDDYKSALEFISGVVESLPSNTEIRIPQNSNFYLLGVYPWSKELNFVKEKDVWIRPVKSEGL
jgi:hypothetical protein